MDLSLKKELQYIYTINAQNGVCLWGNAGWGYMH